MKASLVTLAAFAFLAVGCDPSGTCMADDVGTSSLGARCTINSSKKACVRMTGNPQFFAEDGTAGALRCKSAGYDDPAGAAHATDPSALHIYYKKTAKTK